MSLQPPQNQREHDELARILLENVKDYAILMLDEWGRIICWNAGAERILGYQEAEVLGKSFSQIFTAHDKEKRQPEYELREAKEKGRAEDERWHIRKDGTRFWASGVVMPLRNEDGTVKGFAKILRDITDRKRTEDSLAEANQRKDEFLAILSHELRNPLAGISNAVQLLRMGPADAATVNQATDVIDRQAKMLTGLVHDLLDVSRISSGKVLLHRQRIKLNDVLHSSVQATEPEIASRNHNLVLSAPAESVWLDADPVRIEQIVTNLLCNAAKYTEPGGKIELKVECQGNEAVVRVKDNGTGIQSEMLPRIFEPFIQADRSLDRSQGGLGLGLTLVKRLVEMHGGTVEAFSEGVGMGSEFVVQLPTVPEFIGLAPKVARRLQNSQVDRLNILVAEDNKDTAVGLEKLLSRFGHTVHIAHSGPAAVQLAITEAPDVVILDIGLPGMDGFQAAKHIRGQDQLAHCYLIALTGYGSDEDRRRAQESGFDEHLVKPADFNKLLELITSFRRID